ncbi:oocyte zinc finger protein XlCOF28-like, partial [Argonauta hians]
SIHLTPFSSLFTLLQLIDLSKMSEESIVIADDDKDDGRNNEENGGDDKPGEEDGIPIDPDKAEAFHQCLFCEKSFPNTFLFKIHLKKHSLPLTYLQVKCVGEPLPLGILVGKHE